MEHMFEFMVNHWPLWLALIILLALILVNELRSQQQAGKTVSPQQAVALINHQNALVFDLRNNELFEKGHIIDSRQSSAESFDAGKMDKYKKKSLVLVCGNGLQSSQLATKLKTQGFEDLAALKGGISAWKAASLPIVRGKK